MPATLIPTSPSSALYREAENRFWSSWRGDHTKPTIVNVFYVNHQGHQVWYNYEAYEKRVGNQQYMWHGGKRACNLGDDNLHLTACNLSDCGICPILKSTLDPQRAAPSSMFGLGAYAAPNSSKAANPKLYMKNVHNQSRYHVLLRCAVAVGRTKMAYKPMKGITKPPHGYDSITGATKAQGGLLRYPETVVFKKDAILPVEIIVLKYPNEGGGSDPYASFTRRLINQTDADWNKYPEAISNTYRNEVLWTNGIVSYTFANSPKIRAYKVVRRSPANSPTGTVIAEGYASADPFYFKLQ